MKTIPFDMSKHYKTVQVSGAYMISGDDYYNQILDGKIPVSGVYTLMQSNKTGERFWVSGEYSDKYQNSYNANNKYEF